MARGSDLCSPAKLEPKQANWNVHELQGEVRMLTEGCLIEEGRRSCLSTCTVVVRWRKLIGEAHRASVMLGEEHVGFVGWRRLCVHEELKIGGLWSSNCSEMSSAAMAMAGKSFCARGANGEDREGKNGMAGQHLSDRKSFDACSALGKGARR